MTGAWNVASGRETGRGKRTGPGRDKAWQMWQEISGSCHRNISDRQHVTGPLQGGKGFPVFPERKEVPNKKRIGSLEKRIESREKRDWKPKKRS